MLPSMAKRDHCRCDEIKDLELGGAVIPHYWVGPEFTHTYPYEREAEGDLTYTEKMI